MNENHKKNQNFFDKILGQVQAGSVSGAKLSGSPTFERPRARYWLLYVWLLHKPDVFHISIWLF